MEFRLTWSLGDSISQQAYADSVEGTNLGLIIGLAVAGCVVLTILIIVIFVCIKRCCC
jgi:hypothetical protein